MNALNAEKTKPSFASRLWSRARAALSFGSAPSAPKALPEPKKESLAESETSAAAMVFAAATLDESEKKPFSEPHQRHHASVPFGMANHGIGIIGGRDGRLFDPFGIDSILGDLREANAVYVPPFLQYLMRRSVMPRLANIILGSALSERQYVVEGSSPEIEAFHQSWLDEALPQILRRAPEAVWFGWQPYVINWGRDLEGMITPQKFIDVDPFDTLALEDPFTREFAGLSAEGQVYGLERSFKLTWQGLYGNHYGEGQAVTCFPYWKAHSILLLYSLRYYERSVDPVRLAICRNVSMPTGKFDEFGREIKVDLTKLVTRAMDITGNGDSVGVPAPETGEDAPPVDIKTLDLPDRADTWLKMLFYLEQKQFLATLALPGIGLSAQGDTSFASSRTAEKTQLRVLEYVSNMPLEAINEFLIPLVHKLNGLPGKPPRAYGKEFKREAEETLRDLFKAGMTQPIPVVDPATGRVKPGQFYRPQDLMKFDKVARQLGLPINDILEVARSESQLGAVSPGDGGRPENPNSERGDDRGSGLER